jgi:hypothetical protein
MKMTGPPVTKAIKKLNRIHAQLEKAQAEFDEAVQARYGLTLSEAGDRDIECLVEVSDYGMDITISELDTRMTYYGYEVRRWEHQYDPGDEMVV